MLFGTVGLFRSEISCGFEMLEWPGDCFLDKALAIIR